MRDASWAGRQQNPTMCQCLSEVVSRQPVSAHLRLRNLEDLSNSFGKEAYQLVPDGIGSRLITRVVVS